MSILNDRRYYYAAEKGAETNKLILLAALATAAFGANAKVEKAFARGLEAYCRGDYVRAISNYAQAIKLNPNYAISYYNRANAKRILL